MALEIGGEKTSAMMVALLKEMYATTIITYDQLVSVCYPFFLNDPNDHITGGIILKLTQTELPR